MNDIMLDLETMGTSADSAITAIGACKFDLQRKEIPEDTFYVVVDLQSSVDAGLVIDPATVLWWMKQSDAARAEFQRKGADLQSALLQFSTWTGSHPDLRVWGNGAAFDNVILATAYKKAGMSPPWRFWNDRCYRTKAAERRDIRIDSHGVKHNALDDAIRQAHHLIKICGAS